MATPATTARDTRSVLEDHLAFRRDGRLEDDLARNYHPDVACLSLTGPRRGHGGVREMAAELERDCPDAEFSYDELLINGELGLLVWSATSRRGPVSEATDSFVVRDGMIVAQTVHYHVGPPPG